MISVSKSLEDNTKLAQRFLAGLKPSIDGATVIGFYGDLGSGKTTFTQALAQALGITETVTSPTFVIEKIYQLPRGGLFDRLIHIDCYRLDSPEELRQLGWEEIAADTRNLIVVEWAEKVTPLLPADEHKIYFKFIDETTREITWLP